MIHVDNYAGVTTNLCRLGLVAIGGKPITLGHWSLIEHIVGQNDRTIVFISQNDRIIAGQAPVFNNDMQKIWQLYLLKLLPESVTITPGGIAQLYALIGSLRSESSAFTIYYGDEQKNRKAYAEKEVRKYFGDLVLEGRLVTVPISRETFVNISGTDMRKFLAEGNELAFKSFLPPMSAVEKDEVWKILSTSARPQFFGLT